MSSSKCCGFLQWVYIQVRLLTKIPPTSVFMLFQVRLSDCRQREKRKRKSKGRLIFHFAAAFHRHCFTSYSLVSRKRQLLLFLPFYIWENGSSEKLKYVKKPVWSFSLPRSSPNKARGAWPAHTLDSCDSPLAHFQITGIFSKYFNSSEMHIPKYAWVLGLVTNISCACTR